MKKLTLMILVAVSGILLSCSKEKKLANRLEGIWNVDKYEYTYSNKTVSYANIGTMEFKKDGTGKNNLSYMDSDGTKINDSESFKWSNTENTVTIIGNSNSGSGSTQLWTVDDNSRKTQVWKSTYGGAIATLTMTKK